MQVTTKSPESGPSYPYSTIAKKLLGKTKDVEMDVSLDVDYSIDLDVDYVIDLDVD